MTADKDRAYRTLMTDVVAWANATFPFSTPQTKLAHLLREWDEWNQDRANGEEMADCLMMLAHLRADLDGMEQAIRTNASQEGIHLPWEIARKLEINKARTWGQPDAEGVVEHLREREPEPTRPTVVTLCGSTRFGPLFAQATLDETLAGRIVLSIGCNLRSDQDIFGHLPAEEIERIKDFLDTLHLRKIDLSDEILVLNQEGYCGDSTRREIAYARAHGKRVRWLYLDLIPADLVDGA